MSANRALCTSSQDDFRRKDPNAVCSSQCEMWLCSLKMTFGAKIQTEMKKVSSPRRGLEINSWKVKPEDTRKIKQPRTIFIKDTFVTKINPYFIKFNGQLFWKKIDTMKCHLWKIVSIPSVFVLKIWLLFYYGKLFWVTSWYSIKLPQIEPYPSSH